MTFSFTRAALKDQELEDVSIILENGLVDGRFWLPRRQEIEIRRTGSWLQFPGARNHPRPLGDLLRPGRTRIFRPPFFAGPRDRLAPAGSAERIPVHGHILDALPGRREARRRTTTCGACRTRPARSSARTRSLAGRAHRPQRARDQRCRAHRPGGRARARRGAHAEPWRRFLGRRARALRHGRSRLEGSAKRRLGGAPAAPGDRCRARRFPVRGRRAGGERRAQQHRGAGVRHRPDRRLPVARHSRWGSTRAKRGVRAGVSRWTSTSNHRSRCTRGR